MLHFTELNIREYQEPNCPLCNSKWISFDALLKEVNIKTNALKEFNTIQINQIEDVTKEINEVYISRISKQIDLFLADPQNHMDLGFYNLILEHKGFYEIINRFISFLRTNNINLEQFALKTRTSKEIIENLKERFKNELFSIAASISINEEKLANRQFFKGLFEESEANFKKVELQDLILKRDYLFNEFQSSKFLSFNILNERLNKFNALEKKIDKICKVFDKAIKKYKMDMIDKIKIPFYIFSGKILQNYQQGHGIFIEMQESTNRVRFLTDNNSDHDVIHHLSSGQLAVVSISFCLAMNKVYNTNNNFKFLAIDDPVQTMDDLNVHSFIELMRHDFKDYQILISTHEDNVANYMDYKFKKFGLSCNRYRVQQLFYNAE